MNEQTWTEADAARALRAANRDPAALAYWHQVRPEWRIELASSPDTAPLYLAEDGDRIAWVADRDEAKTFASDFLAWDFVAANVQSLVRVRC
ncbi:hypothetical protein [Methylobacterium oxalidis]|uniref:Uncharacterized protein n=1 Tax=Methylobacterium oxalidis TaxID=944322 RepID=A0A512J266_9HYPH|nr:hypothetical protein [Methylobacterium oxalidis]GEP04046.1 hypothetical protein MOX02_20840 [Methylobacterium oxalidis]GJE34829.1 hypothetical protein LDDCCGHA_5044 [Methylobacterium oxalidis]GLS64077.1 hypothetical protein GCM10007888_24580 [Methylobacterium oxalidis]